MWVSSRSTRASMRGTVPATSASGTRPVQSEGDGAGVAGQSARSDERGDDDGTPRSATAMRPADPLHAAPVDGTRRRGSGRGRSAEAQAHGDEPTARRAATTTSSSRSAMQDQRRGRRPRRSRRRRTFGDRFASEPPVGKRRATGGARAPASRARATRCPRSAAGRRSIRSTYCVTGEGGGERRPGRRASGACRARSAPHGPGRRRTAITHAGRRPQHDEGGPDDLERGRPSPTATASAGDRQRPRRTGAATRHSAGLFAGTVDRRRRRTW